MHLSLLESPRGHGEVQPPDPEKGSVQRQSGHCFQCWTGIGESMVYTQNVNDGIKEPT